MQTYRVAMADGTQLATDIYLPEGEGRWPVLVARSPYRRTQLRPLAEAMAARGYGVLLQDVRGTGESEGSFGFLAQEPADALATASWLLAQPWCDGRLGILGISYLSAASIAIAAEMPERVKACFWLTMPVRRDLLAFEHGALRLHHAAPWSMLVQGLPLQGRDWPTIYATLPLAEAAAESAMWRTYAAQEGPDAPFWLENDLGHLLDKVKAPGLHAGGWYCFLNEATIAPYRLLAERSGAPQRLIMGPWTHNSTLMAPEVQAAMGEWFDHWFKGAPLSGAPVQLKPEGGEWVGLTAWSEPAKPLYLTPDRRLLDTPVEGTHRFTADPLNPVPTQGGALWEFPLAGLTPGPLPQSTAGRPDVLTYDSQPLAAPLSLCGTAELELWASASTADADFTAKLSDVAPDGTARYITDGIVRARYRNGLDHSQPLTPGQVYHFHIRMYCGHRLEAGHRLRLEVAGHNFPKYDRNLHHGGSMWHSGPETALPSHREVRLGPSRLLLPEG